MVNSLLFLTMAVSACVQAGVVHQRQLPWTGPGGKVADPPNAAPRKQILKSSLTSPGVQSIKIRYVLVTEYPRTIELILDFQIWSIFCAKHGYQERAKW